ncbi:MAG: hypothetical protein QM831_05300 [Kofleriaceae bacterium]
MRLAVVVAALSLVACHKKPPSDCAPAISSAMDKMVIEMRSKMGETAVANVKRMLPEMKKSITEACETDHWSAAVIECIKKAPDKTALGLCDQMLTPQQRQNEHKRDDDLLRAAVQPLQKPDADREKKDPHAGLGIPPADELRARDEAGSAMAPAPGSAGSAVP